jgi:hypothetical protein
VQRIDPQIRATRLHANDFALEKRLRGFWKRRKKVGDGGWFLGQGVGNSIERQAEHATRTALEAISKFTHGY